jgi:ubiquinone/menaquinone biosynthesis C-methylase UbiE
MVSYYHWYTAIDRSNGVYPRLLDQVFGPGQYVGQQGFATRDQIVELAQAVGAAPGARVLDVCSGPAGPAACIAAATGCRVISLDRSLPALRLAQDTGGIQTRLVAADAQRS